MSIVTSANADHTDIRLRLPERFDFSMHREFRKAYEAGKLGEANFTVDLRMTSSLDSAALGMLLQMWEHSGKRPAGVRIVNASPTVRQILAIANFDKLMRID